MTLPYIRFQSNSQTDEHLHQKMLLFLVEGNWDAIQTELPIFEVLDTTEFWVKVACALVQCTEDSKVEGLKWILEAYPEVASLKIGGQVESGSVLHSAIQGSWYLNASEQMFELFLKHGFDIEAPYHYTQKEEIPISSYKHHPLLEGNTPLLTCALYGNDLFLKLLLDQKVNFYAKNNAGFGFLDILRQTLQDHPLDALRCLKIWLNLDEGRRQMKEQCENENHLKIFLQNFRTETEKFLMEEMAQHLQQTLPKAHIRTPLPRL